MQKKSRRRKDLETLAVLAAASLICSLLFRKPAFIGLALALLALPLVSPKAAERLAGLWLGFSGVLGAVNTRLALGAVYFLLLTPVAFLFRLLHGGALNAKADPAASTYFEERKHLYVPADLEEPW
ncbi:MAG: hypothetical protein HY550_10870 [Elusimicrobia bacterium]|nr:hypothetical protein [Elusimicrobiota bacterium]